MRYIDLITSILCCVTFSCLAEEENSPPIGYLRTDIYAQNPISLNGTSHLTTHLFNISPAPVQMQIDRLSYQPLFVQVGTPAAPTKDWPGTDVWGPGIEKNLVIDMDRLNRVLVSGYGKDGSFPSWPKRYGIIVLKDEGYARKITFLPGWLDQKELPVGYEHLTNLVVNASPPMKVQTPLLIPEAVQPGKPILFDKLHGVMVPGDRLVPFKANFYSQEPEKKPADSTGLSLEIEIWNPVEAGKDITAVYLVGNNGPGSVWVWQNALVPAHATWEVHRSDKKAISTISGEALQVLADLLPERPPIPLNPGEYLTFRRILPASKLPLKRREKYTLTLAIDAQWFPTPPESKDQAQVTQLATTLEIQPQ